VATALLLSCAAWACGGDKGRVVPADTKAAGTNPANASGNPGSPDSGGEKRTVLFLGTSLTAGLGLDPDSAFPQQLQRKIDASHLPYQTVNAGVSGETAAGLLRRLDWVLQSPAAVILVETGANDGLRGQPVEATKATIGQVLARIKRERPEAHVMLVQMEAPPNLGMEYTRAFHAMFPALAKEYQVQLLPFLLEAVAGRADLNQADGIHPNLSGERKVTEQLWKSLQPVLVAGGGAPLP
jgi:acyl-CoA thioesterase-1